MAIFESRLAGRYHLVKSLVEQEVETLSGNDPIKVYDARWEVDEFDDAAVRRLFEATFAYGRELEANTVTLARDARLGAGRVLDIARETGLRMGFRVLCCDDPVSTPQSYFMTLHASQRYPGSMGLTITASHNPKDYVGVKFVVPTVRAVGLDCGPAGGLTRIRELYHSAEPFSAVARGQLEVVNLTREYVDFSMQQAGIEPGGLSGVAVVLDALNGSAGAELLMALESAGVRVEPLRLRPDGNFPTGSPNPTVRGKLDEAVRLAADRDCDVVIGLDGDGDRIVFGDRQGLFSAGFAATAVLRASGLNDSSFDRPVVLYDPKVNPLALAEWGKLGFRPILFRNGHSQIKEYMREIGAIAAAEESGHYYHRVTMGPLTITCENSILTTLLFLKAIKYDPGLLDELWSQQRAVRTTGELNYQFIDDDKRDRAMAAVVRRFTRDGADRITATPDGIDLGGVVLSKGVVIEDASVELQPDWYSGFLRIATNEKGVVRSYFSAADRDQLDRIETQARSILAGEFNGQPID